MRPLARFFRKPSPDGGKPIIVFFNDFFGRPVDIAAISCGSGCVFTADRRKLKEAAAVVFHIPSLRRIGRIKKSPDQLCVGWSMESRSSYPLLADASFMQQFDLTMTYERSADIGNPYLPARSAFDLALATPLPRKTAAAPVVLLQSATFDRSGRNAFTQELMSHIKVDSYGRFLNNRTLTTPDRGRDTKLATIAAYKFCLAFENSIAEDYVTEKFFDPLLSGTVPVYRGAPNVDLFAPGDNAYIDASRFSGPGELAEFLIHLDNDEQEYRRYFAWRESRLSSGFVELLSRAPGEPFCRLCEIVADRRRSL